MVKYWAKKFKNILLTGMPAAGKTTFGKIYALHSDRFFLDFDHFLESMTKKTITQIFQQEGEERFRVIEEKVLRKLERRHHFVIALGGGTLIQPHNIAFARKLGLIVTLSAKPDELAQRIFSQKEKKPLFLDCLSQEAVERKINTLLKTREDAYNQSDVMLDTSYNTLDSLKMHLSLIEKRANYKEYMQDIQNIMNKKNKNHPTKYRDKKEEQLGQKNSS
jgi:shikimate kinase